jgi:uncharacterized membrane protein
MNSNNKKFYIIILLVIASAIAGYLQLSREGAIIGCSAGSGCDNVLSSPWSKIFGVSILLPGLFTYGIMILCVLMGTKNSALLKLGSLLSWLVILAAIWFLIVQLFILKAFCPWCCTIHGLAIVAAALYLYWQPKNEHSRWRTAFEPALILIVMFAVGQLISPSSNSGFRANEVGAIALGASTNKITLYGGELNLKLDELPVIVAGNPEAVCIILSDYSCPHCLEFHRMLIEKGDEIAEVASVYFLPAYQSHESRELNRLMLILQRANHELYIELMADMASGALSLDYRQLKIIADERLAGHLEIYYRSYGYWAHQAIEAGKTLMKLNHQHSQASVYPQAIMGTQLIEGVMPLGSFLSQLKEHAGVQPMVSKTNHPHPVADRNTSLVFDNMAIDLGRIAKGYKGDGVIRISNPGAEDASIIRVGRTCGCIELEMKPLVVPAKGEVKVPFKFDTSRFLGKVTHSAVFHEKNGGDPFIIPITVDVWLPVFIYPFENNMGPVAVTGSSTVKTIPLITKGDQEVRLKLGESGHTAIEADLVTIRQGRHYELKIKINNMPDAEIASYVKVLTDQQDCPVITLPVHASPSKVVDYYPKQLHSKALINRSLASVTIGCTDAAQQENFKVINTSYVGDASVKISREIDPKFKSVKISLQWPANSDFNETKRQNEYLLIQTNHKDFQTIKIPYSMTANNIGQ